MQLLSKWVNIKGLMTVQFLSKWVNIKALMTVPLLSKLVNSKALMTVQLLSKWVNIKALMTGEYCQVNIISLILNINDIKKNWEKFFILSLIRLLLTVTPQGAVDELYVYG